MPKAIYNSLNGGFWDSYLSARKDTEKYYSSCRELTNAVPLKQGGAKKANGTLLVHKAKNTSAIRLEDFVVNVNVSYVLEFGAQYMRFFNNQAIITKSVTITGATQANPVVITATNDLVGDEIITITDVVGMTELNGNEYTVANPTGTTFELSGVDGTGYTAYTSGGTGTYPYEIITTYAEADLFNLQIEQVNDIAYITDGSYPIRKLTRLASDNWTIADVDFAYPPFLQENSDTSHTLRIDDASSKPAWATSTSYTAGNHVEYEGFYYTCASNHTSGDFRTDMQNGNWTVKTVPTTTSVTLTSTSALFTANHVGGFFALTHPIQSKGEKLNINANKTGQWFPIAAGGGWQLITSGIWTATVVVERTFDGGTTVEQIEFFDGTNNENYNEQRTENRESEVRVRVQNYTSNTSAAFNFSITKTERTGYIEVTGYTNATTVTGTVERTIENEAETSFWREGAFSDEKGHPTAAAVFEEALWLARGQEVFRSKIGSFEDFEETSLDTSALRLVATGSGSDEILWMENKNELILGGAGAEYALTRGDQSVAISPSNIPTIRKQSGYGSKSIKPILVNESIVYIQSDGETIRELQFDVATQTFKSNNLTKFAEPLTRASIVDIAYQQKPYQTIHAVTEDGRCPTLSFDNEEDLFGWADNQMQQSQVESKYESVAVIPGIDFNEVWYAVNRDGFRTIERQYNPSEAYETTQETPGAASVQIAVLVDSDEVSTDWTPADIDAAGWYDAYDPVTRGNVTLGPEIPLQDYKEVLIWNDLSGNDNHLLRNTKASENEGPNYDANVTKKDRIALEFQDSGFTFTDSSKMISDEINTIVVFSLQNEHGSSVNLLCSSDSGTDTDRFGYRAMSVGGSSYPSYGDYGTPSLYVYGELQNEVTFKQSEIYSFLYDYPVIPELRLYGEIGGSTSNWLDVGIGEGVLGGSGWGTGDSQQSWYGYLREIVIVTGSLSESDRQKIEGYLAHRWDNILGVTTLVSNLQSGHPYKTSAPVKANTDFVDYTTFINSADWTSAGAVPIYNAITAANTEITNTFGSNTSTEWALVSYDDAGFDAIVSAVNDFSWRNGRAWGKQMLLFAENENSGSTASEADTIAALNSKGIVFIGNTVNCGIQ